MKSFCHIQLIFFSVNHLIFVYLLSKRRCPLWATNKHQWGAYYGIAAQSLAQIPFPAFILVCPRGTSWNKRGKLMDGLFEVNQRKPQRLWLNVCFSPSCEILWNVTILPPVLLQQPHWSLWLDVCLCFSGNTLSYNPYSGSLLCFLVLFHAHPLVISERGFLLW